MSINFKQFLKKAWALITSLIGWGSLLFLWYEFLFKHNGIYRTLNAVKILSLLALILFIFCFLWNHFNIEAKIFHQHINPDFIRFKAKDWTWSEVSIDENDNIIMNKERLILICKQKEDNLSSTKRLSYAAILIRDGCIREALGFLRQILSDPYIGQLTRKIVESELNLIFEDGNTLNILKECSVMNEINNKADKPFHISIFGYNKKQVDEFLNELMMYNWNLEEENKELKTDLINYNKKTQLKYSSNISNARWEEKEFSLLLGLTLQDDVLDYKGNVICKKNTIITTQLIESLIMKGLYGELVSAADPSKGVERFAK